MKRTRACRKSSATSGTLSFCLQFIPLIFASQVFTNHIHHQLTIPGEFLLADTVDFEKVPRRLRFDLGHIVEGFVREDHEWRHPLFIRQFPPLLPEQFKERRSIR